EEYLEAVEYFNELEIDMIELNISCPNVKSRGLVAQDPRAAYDAVKAAKKGTGKTLIVKLSPNVTDITEIARAVETAGADAVSLINTVYGMSIDADTRKPRLGNVIGGLSGPAIKPVALKMVYDVSRSIKIPVIGMGGILSFTDAVEFLVAGATAISVGTGNFINPAVSLEIIKGIERYLRQHTINSVRDLTGSLKI
ncbi:MAG: dihydroorotate dehydrogenase, partial [Candidatus Omnitrophica bacterium]|nr:dihydroorotate dehydrogenase [Candidatus Omnitrophota bacterium]